MKVAFIDLNAAYLELNEELDAAYRRVMESGWYILGQEVRAFEQEFAEYCGTAHALMAFDVVVMEKAEFAQWVEAQRASAIEHPPECGSAVRTRGEGTVSARRQHAYLGHAPSPSVTGRHSASRSTTSRQARCACRGW